MNLLKNLFSFYIASSIHVALSATALTIMSLLTFNLMLDLNLLLFVFFGTITGYNFVKYAGIAKFYHLRLELPLKLMQIFSFFCFLILIFFLLQLPFRVLLWVSFFGLLTGFYAVPIFGDRKNLRMYYGLKVYLIAIVWAGVTVILPLVFWDLTFNTTVFLELLQRFVFIMVLILPFEIRDLSYDVSELGTIPQRLGIKKTKHLGYVLLLIFVSIEIFKAEASLEKTISVILTSLILMLVLKFSKKEQAMYYSSFWVELIPVLWLGMYYGLGLVFD